MRTLFCLVTCTNGQAPGRVTRATSLAQLREGLPVSQCKQKRKPYLRPLNEGPVGCALVAEKRFHIAAAMHDAKDKRVPVFDAVDDNVLTRVAIRATALGRTVPTATSRQSGLPTRGSGRSSLRAHSRPNDGRLCLSEQPPTLLIPGQAISADLQVYR